MILTINNKNYEVDEKYGKETLLFVLREILNLTGTKEGCGTNDCGACKVLIDGEAINSCILIVNKVIGKKIETIEGIAEKGVLHPLQEAFVQAGAVQCGFCTPGMIMSAKSLLDKNSNPSREEVEIALDKNLCRCTGYVKIVDAIMLASEMLKKY